MYFYLDWPDDMYTNSDFRLQVGLKYEDQHNACWFPSENSDEGGDINNNSIINADWSMGDVEYGRWINQFDDADESKKSTLKPVTEEIPATVSRRAPDKEARPITLKSKAKLLKD